LSKDFLWELESLRRRFGVEDDDFRAAVKQLTRKPRGAKPQDDSQNLALISAGVSLSQVATEKGLSDAAQIKLGRKSRRAWLRSQYLQKIDEISDLIVPLSPEVRSAAIDTIAAVEATYLPGYNFILLDIADCCLRRTQRSDLEGARFRLASIEGIDLDSPTRRKIIRAQIQVLEKVLRQLRTPKNT
jgi:hypothetical protein